MNLSRIALVVLLAFVVTACAAGSEPNTASNNAAARTAQPTPAAVSQTPAVKQLVAGQNLYVENCVACHKEDGTGGRMDIEGKTIDVDDLTQAKIRAFSDEKITRYIKNGIPDEGMPAFKDKLSDTQMAEIVSYIRSDIQKP